MAMADVRYWFDPVCPFCWITSRWMTQVAELRSMTVDWRFISLRIINDDKDYTTHFPPHYERSHTGGLRLLRVCAAARERHGSGVVGELYGAYGAVSWEGGREGVRDRLDDLSERLGRERPPSHETFR